jgi:hypothetical protein
MFEDHPRHKSDKFGMCNERRDSRVNGDFLSALAVSTFLLDFVVRILPVFQIAEPVS